MSSSDNHGFDARKRHHEKAVARERDREAVERGEKSREDLRAENGAFAFPPGRVVIEPRRGRF